MQQKFSTTANDEVLLRETSWTRRQVFYSLQAQWSYFVGEVNLICIEQLLLPQIAQEALGNQLVQAVRALSRRATAQKARSTLAEAWTPPASSSVSADLNQLSEPTVRNLLSGVEAEAMQRRFLGRDWSRLVREDILRFVACEKMVLAGSSSERRIRREQDQRQGHDLGQDENHEATMAWIDPGQDGPLGEEYPALTELLLRLHLLPFEINSE